MIELSKLINKESVLIVVYILSKIRYYISTLEENNVIIAEVISFLVLREIIRFYSLPNLVVLDRDS